MTININNINNIKPCWWGSHVWKTIYFMVAVYPDHPTQIQIESICNFFQALKHLLPCQTCQESYKKISCESTTNAEYLDNFKTIDKLIFFVFTHDVGNKVSSQSIIKIFVKYILFVEYAGVGVLFIGLIPAEFEETKFRRDSILIKLIKKILYFLIKKYSILKILVGISSERSSGGFRRDWSVQGLMTFSKKKSSNTCTSS